jgi:hypothetical protein
MRYSFSLEHFGVYVRYLIRELFFDVFAGNIMTIYFGAGTQKFKFLMEIYQSFFLFCTP